MLRHARLFAATALVLNATPGVDLMLTLRADAAPRQARGGGDGVRRRAGCVATRWPRRSGLAALLAASAAAFGLLKWAGAAYLLWLAVGMLARGRMGAATALDARQPARSRRPRRVDRVLRPTCCPTRVIPQVVDALPPGARLRVRSSRMGSSARAQDQQLALPRLKAALNSVLKGRALITLGERRRLRRVPSGWCDRQAGAGAA